jgi:hypothetical protein
LPFRARNESLDARYPVSLMMQAEDLLAALSIASEKGDKDAATFLQLFGPWVRARMQSESMEHNRPLTSGIGAASQESSVSPLPEDEKSRSTLTLLSSAR